MFIKLDSRRTLVQSFKFNPEAKLAVEVGVRDGWFSRFMLANTDMIVHSVDPWEVNQELGNPDWCYEHCKNILAPFGERSKMIKAYSPDICKEYEDNSVDLVYIDGLHDYQSVKADMNGWYPKVKSNGILSGHDFNPDKWPGVVQAVNEFCRENNLHFCLTGLAGNFQSSNGGARDDWDSDEHSWVIIKR